MTKENELISKSITREAKEYLAPLGFDFEYFEAEGDRDFVGLYEFGSAETGTIRVDINFDEIERDSTDFEDDLRITVFHEIGHGLFEFINRLPEPLIEPYFKEFFDIFFDDNGIDEEDIVEQFGFSFDANMHTTSELRTLITRMKDEQVLPYENTFNDDSVKR